VMDGHFDGYSVLRSTELALGVPGLGRFDEAAQDFSAVFASPAPASGTRDPALLPALALDDAATTRGTSADTYGQVTVPAAVRQGEPLEVLASDTDSGTVALAAMNATPSAGVPLLAGHAEVPTGGARPGRYVLWLKRDGEAWFRAPRLVNILAPQRPKKWLGVRLPGAEIDFPGNAPVVLREGGNTVIAYCRPDDVPAARTWVAVVAAGAPADSVHFPSDAGPGDVIRLPDGRTPEGRRAYCAEAAVYTARLLPATEYRIQLLVQQGDGRPQRVGEEVRFRVQAALP